MRHSIGIGAAGGIITRVINCLSHAPVTFQRLFQPAGANRPGIGSGRQARLTLEQAMEMIGGIADMNRDLIQRWRSLRTLYQRQRSFDRQPVAPNLIRATAQAGPKSRRPRCRGVGIETDILALGVAGRATGLAIDAGCQHCPYKLPVHVPVATRKRVPAGGIVGHWRSARTNGSRVKRSHLVHPYQIVRIAGRYFPPLAFKASAHFPIA